MTDLIRLSACEIVALLDQGSITPGELLDVLEVRVSQVNERINALPTLCFERARDYADRLMVLPMTNRGLLRGLPVPIKDLTMVAGVRTTFGSKIHEYMIPEISDVLVETLESNGGIVYAKSNTPEFGAGGNTFNDVFGSTRNPHDLNRTAGGSSGGAAAALASGMAWLAHGSDLAGSLRTPASFCGVSSLRPSPGLIASGPSALLFEVQFQQGPMARNILDLALFTDALVGESSMAGLCKPLPKESFSSAAARPQRPVRVAFSNDLGVTKTSPEVLSVCQMAMVELEQNGITVEYNQPDLTGVDEVFDVSRALGYAITLGENLDATRHLLKPELVWNVEQGLSLDSAAIRRSMITQAQLFERAAKFMQDYDLLICPAAIVPAIPVEERYLGYSQGVEISDYYRWLAITYAITVITLPVITIPCGKTPDGLPIGLQLIGSPHGDQHLFSLASYIEQLLEYDTRPINPLGQHENNNSG